MESDELTFEAALARLEEVVSVLENEETPLNQALEAYEEGMRLSKKCMSLLEEAKLKVQQIGIEEE